MIGTTYGSGDGSTTFNLPNLSNRFIEGAAENDAKLNQKISAGLPNIKGQLAFQHQGQGSSLFNYDGGIKDAFYVNASEGSAKSAAVADVSADRYPNAYFDASKGTFDKSGNKIAQANSPYGNADTVQPASIRMVYIICQKLL